MTAKLLQIVESTTPTPEAISASTERIRAELLAQSKYIAKPNFTRIHTDDLGLLFVSYDRTFFQDAIRETLGTTPLTFGLSKRMTSAGGKTTWRTNRATGRRSFEISISSTNLYAGFEDDDHRAIVVNGLPCRDRVDALQRVMEHELVHLIEMLLWNKSSCNQPRFHAITHAFFGHTFNKHHLITPKEKARVKFGISPGTRVRFRFEGIERVGMVNRVNNRATVLVEDPRGRRYTDGKHYAKFYVPVQMLEAVQ